MAQTAIQFHYAGEIARFPRPCKMRFQILAMLGGVGLVATSALFAQDHAKSPADGYDIHIVAPHRHEDGTVHGPYHHYCKAIKPEVMQCMIFESTDPNAELVEIEYFIDKKLVRGNVTLEQWNKHYHDHTEEIATGTVKVLDLPPRKAKAIAAAAAKTDGIIFHLWPQGAKVPNGDVSFPTAISHNPVQTLVIPN
jgi:hypothetical protein